MYTPVQVPVTWLEETWITSCEQSHKLFCSCPDWVLHLSLIHKRINPEQWSMVGGDEPEDGGPDHTEGGGSEDIDDQLLLEALEEVEGGEDPAEDALQ